ncbi:2443_t:CDS:1, partial [Gigaspora rosea]
CVPPPPPIFEPEPEVIHTEPIQNDQNIVTIEVFETLQQQVVYQNQTIEQFQQQVQKLENFNQQLLCLIHQRTETLTTL